MKKVDPSKIKELLAECYSGAVKYEKAGIKIRCPWHSPDNNPSCMIFLPSGTFYCVVCHGDQPKGKRGVSPYRGFRALGMSEDRARRHFLSSEIIPMSFESPLTRLPSFDAPPTEEKRVFFEKVDKRELWPKDWGFRELEADTMSSVWFRKRFEPTKVVLKKERLPRLALSIGGAEKYKNCDHPNYIHHEVFLRLSSMVKPKSINSHGLTLDPDVQDPLPATMFGLINNKLIKGCRGLILTEGPYDCLHLLQQVHQNIGGGFDVAALLGTPQFENCYQQIIRNMLPEMIKKHIPIILAFDNDAAGVKLTHTALTKFQSFSFLPKDLLKVLTYPNEIKDPGEMPSDVFRESLRAIEVI